LTNRLFERRDEKKREGGNKPQETFSSRRHTTQDSKRRANQDRNPRPQRFQEIQPYATQPAANSSTGPGPMDVDATTRRRHLSPAERERRLQNNLCLYCGRAGHVAADHRTGRISAITANQITGADLAVIVPPKQGNVTPQV
jgi:hypothetical protein